MKEENKFKVLIGVILTITILLIVLPIGCTIGLAKLAVDEVNEKGIKGISEEIWEGK